MKALSAVLTLAFTLVVYGIAVFQVWDVNLASPEHWQTLVRSLKHLEFNQYSTQLLTFLGVSLLFVLIGIPASITVGILFLSNFWSKTFQLTWSGIKRVWRAIRSSLLFLGSPFRRLVLWRPPVTVRARLSWQNDLPLRPEEVTAPSSNHEPVMEIAADETRVSIEPAMEDKSEEATPVFGLQLDEDVRPASNIIPTLRDYFHGIKYQCRLDIALDPSTLGDAGFMPDEFGEDAYTMCDMIAFGAEQIIILQILDLGGASWTGSTSLSTQEWTSEDGEVAPCPIYRAAKAMRRFKQQFAASLALAPDELVGLIVLDNGTLIDDDHMNEVYDYVEKNDGLEIVHLSAPGVLDSLFAETDSPYPAAKIDFITSLAHKAAA
jgi:hypothetical protein